HEHYRYHQKNKLNLVMPPGQIPEFQRKQLHAGHEQQRKYDGDYYQHVRIQHEGPRSSFQERKTRDKQGICRRWQATKGMCMRLIDIELRKSQSGEHHDDERSPWKVCDVRLSS